jgi:hypothetical protein
MRLRGGLRRLLILAAALSALAGGCYELPPKIPADYARRPLPAAWPPPSVYAAEPFHPANRWFQRAFGPRDEAGHPLPAESSLPFPLLDTAGPIDRAELLALLESLVREGLPPEADAVTRAMLHADLLAAAARWRRGAGAEEALALAHESAAKALAAVPLEADRRLQPPPLRSGAWVAARAAPGVEPSDADLRWSRMFYSFEEPPAAARREAGEEAERPPARAALLRLRMVAGPGGVPERSELPSECWLLERTPGGEVEPRLYRFDRAAWLAGEDPWRESAGEDLVAIRNPLAPEAPLLEGPLRSLCASCHRPEQPFLGWREGWR